MRIRTLKPEWLDDERMVLASSDARVTSIALILMADDYGNGRANDRLLTGRIFPGESVGKIREALDELSEMGFVELYEVRGQAYYSIRNWKKHQRVDKPGKPRVPGPCEASENIRETPGNFPVRLAPDLDPDPDPDPERRTVRDTVPAPPVRTTWQRVGKLYRERYLEAKRGKVLDYHIQAHVQQWEDLARLVDGYPDPIAACEQALDGFFRDSWVKSKDYPPSALVKQFGKYYDPPSPPESEKERDARIQRQREEEAWERNFKRQKEEEKKWQTL